MHKVVLHGLAKLFPEIFDLSPDFLEVGIFPISLKESHKSAHMIQRGRLLFVITLGYGNLERYRVYQIIVLIVICLKYPKNNLIFAT